MTIENKCFNDKSKIDGMQEDVLEDQWEDECGIHHKIPKVCSWARNNAR